MAEASRPARKQADAPAPGPARAATGNSALEINIWSGKPLQVVGTKRKAAGPARRSAKCDPERDEGRTRAREDAQGFVCLHFARGECARGADCTFLHRVPANERHSETHDVFGRDRFSTERADMGGTGSFQRANRSLFLNGYRALPNAELEVVI